MVLFRLYVDTARRCGHPGDTPNSRRDGSVFVYPNRVRYSCIEFEFGTHVSRATNCLVDHIACARRMANGQARCQSADVSSSNSFHRRVRTEHKELLLHRLAYSDGASTEHTEQLLHKLRRHHHHHLQFILHFPLIKNCSPDLSRLLF